MIGVTPTCTMLVQSQKSNALRETYNYEEHAKIMILPQYM